jgi:hypothetical protein
MKHEILNNRMVSNKSAAYADTAAIMQPEKKRTCHLRPFPAYFPIQGKIRGAPGKAIS